MFKRLITMRISIVIPAYNEQYHLPLCLEAISHQTAIPYQVIVVDNNSTDNTAEIAQSYNFVTLLHEKTQGIVFARNTGFNAATGDIIARIDADTIMPCDWLEQINKTFTTTNIDAVTGSVYYHDSPFKTFNNKTDLYFRSKIANYLDQQVGYLYGSNMALRRQAWFSIQSETCNTNSIHEDLDLAIHLKKHNYKICFDQYLNVGVSIRCIETNLIHFYKYIYKNPATYGHHNLSQKRIFYPLIGLLLINYLPIRIGLRFIDPQTQKIHLFNNHKLSTSAIAANNFVIKEKLAD